MSCIAQTGLLAQSTLIFTVIIQSPNEGYLHATSKTLSTSLAPSFNRWVTEHQISSAWKPSHRFIADHTAVGSNVRQTHTTPVGESMTCDSLGTGNHGVLKSSLMPSVMVATKPCGMHKSTSKCTSPPMAAPWLRGARQQTCHEVRGFIRGRLLSRI